MDDIVKQAMAKWPDVPSVYGWLGLDRRRLPLKMTVKIPILGRITAILVKYKSPK